MVELLRSICVGYGCRNHITFYVAAAVNGWGRTELFLEKFDKMRWIREITFRAHLCDRLTGRYQEQARVHEPLPDEPFVGRFEKLTFELLFE